LLLLALDGVLLLRCAHRALFALLFQLPPRKTRFEPVGRRMNDTLFRVKHPKPPVISKHKTSRPQLPRHPGNPALEILRKTPRRRTAPLPFGCFPKSEPQVLRGSNQLHQIAHAFHAFKWADTPVPFAEPIQILHADSPESAGIRAYQVLFH
jgi:hypothetical protein